MAGRLGVWAGTNLPSLIAGRSIICERKDTDGYGRKDAFVAWLCRVLC